MNFEEYLKNKKYGDNKHIATDSNTKDIDREENKSTIKDLNDKNDKEKERYKNSENKKPYLKDKNKDNENNNSENKDDDKMKKKGISSSSLCPKCRRAKDHCRC